MKAMKAIWIAAMMMTATALHAQEDDQKKGDTTSFHLGNMKIMVTEDHSSGTTAEEENNDEGQKEKLAHWAGFEVGVNGYLDRENSFTLEGTDALYELDYSKSQVWRLNFAEKKFRIIKEYVGLVTGMGVSFHGYAFKKNMTLQGSGNSTWAREDSIRYQKNKLKVTYLEIPLLLEINSSDDEKKTFHIAGGLVGGYKIGSRLKQKYQDEGDKVRNKVAGHYNLNPFRLNAAARVGYGKMTLFAEYALMTLFENNKGPELYPFSAGITLVGF